MEGAFSLLDGEWPVNKGIKINGTIDKTKKYMGAKESWAQLYVFSSDSLAEVVKNCDSLLESYVIIETSNPAERIKCGGATVARGTCHYHLIMICG